MTDDTLFGKIIRREIPADIVFEDEHLIAFRDIAPQAPVHVLIIPRAHYGSMDDVPDASVVGALSMLAQQVARSEGIAATGYRCVINTGVDGAQTVGHLHMHLLGGRGLGWPPG